MCFVLCDAYDCDALGYLKLQVSVEFQLSIGTANLDPCKAAVSRNLNQTLEMMCDTLNLTEREPICPVVHFESIQSADNCPPGYKQEEDLCSE